MSFSLSPSVAVREFDLSLTIPNLPSAKTGMVLPAETGPCNVITPIASESDLVTKFGKPSKTVNEKEWFNAWNFLQYASSLYPVRPLPFNEEGNPSLNAAVKFNVAAGVTSFAQGVNPAGSDYALHNEDLAKINIEYQSSILDLGSRLTFYNRYVTNKKDVAVAICSSAEKWNSPIVNDIAAKGQISFVAGTGGCVLDAGSGKLTYPAGISTLGLVDASAFAAGDGFVFNGRSVVITDVNLTTNVVTFTPSLSANVVEQSSGGTPIAQYIRSYDYIYDGSLITSTSVGGTSVGTYIIGVGSYVVEELASFSSLFEFEPDWSKDELAVVILDKSLTGKYEVAEKYTVSYLETGRDHNGRNSYVQEVINSLSKKTYVVVGSGVDKVETADIALPRILGNASSFCSTITVQQVVLAEDLYTDPESFDINILISSRLNQNGMANVATARKDCFAVVAPYDELDIIGKSNTDATKAICDNYGSKTSLIGSGRDFSAFTNYAGIFGNMKYQYDKYNDVNVWLPIHGDVAGLMAQTDANRDPWWAAAGLERGKIKNAIRLAFNPNKQNRDDLYVNSVNSIMSIPGEGNAVIWGQKTAVSKPSAFDRINVRRLLITIEKAIASASRYGLFEFNDSFTRTRLYTLIEPFLRQVKAKRGVYDYLVVIDDSNNTPEVIDANALVIDVYVKPEKVAEFINLNVNVTRTDANFSELVGKAP